MQVVFIRQLPLMPHTHNDSQVSEIVTCEHCSSRLSITIDDVRGRESEAEAGYLRYFVTCPVCYRASKVSDDVEKRLEESGAPVCRYNNGVITRNGVPINI